MGLTSAPPMFPSPTPCRDWPHPHSRGEISTEAIRAQEKCSLPQTLALPLGPYRAAPLYPWQSPSLTQQEADQGDEGRSVPATGWPRAATAHGPSAAHPLPGLLSPIPRGPFQPPLVSAAASWPSFYHAQHPAPLGQCCGLNCVSQKDMSKS